MAYLKYTVYGTRYVYPKDEWDKLSENAKRNVEKFCSKNRAKLVVR